MGTTDLECLLPSSQGVAAEHLGQFMVIMSMNMAIMYTELKLIITWELKPASKLLDMGGQFISGITCLRADVLEFKDSSTKSIFCDPLLKQGDQGTL